MISQMTCHAAQTKSSSIIRSRAVIGLAVLGLSCLAGCGGSGDPPTVPISGTVTYKGEPIKAGQVRFTPVDPKTTRPAEGKIQPDGSFTIETFKPGDGAMAGEYSISLIPLADDPTMLAKDVSAAQKKGPFPEKYANPKTSGLKETVTLGQPKKDLTLELTD